MDQLTDIYKKRLQDLENTKKSIISALDGYKSLREELSVVEGEIQRLQSKLNQAAVSSGGIPLYLQMGKPYAGLSILNAAKKYLTNGATDRTMKGISKVLVDNSIAKSYNSVQAVINKHKSDFEKKGNEWFVRG